MPEKSKIYSGRLGKGKSVFSIPSLYKDQKWVAYSKKFLSINKKCYACGEKSQATDHWRAHKNRKEFFWNPNNMLPLCFNCHKEKETTALAQQQEQQTTQNTENSSNAIWE